jgi:hypothetical protein
MEDLVQQERDPQNPNAMSSTIVSFKHIMTSNLSSVRLQPLITLVSFNERQEWRYYFTSPNERVADASSK